MVIISLRGGIVFAARTDYDGKGGGNLVCLELPLF